MRSHPVGTGFCRGLQARDETADKWMVGHMSPDLSQNQYRAILESLPSGIYVVDLDRRILFWNSGAEKITGYLRHEVIGRRCPDNLLRHCNEDYLPLCETGCPLQGTMSEGQPHEADVYLRHKKGQRVPVRVRSVPIRDAAGAIIGAAESFDERHPARETQMHAHALAVENRLDRLTGISDRVSVAAYLKAALADFADDHAPLGILSLRVDGLESLQKRYGGEGTHRVIRTVAETLAKNVPPGAVVGWANDRFVVLLADCPAGILGRIGLMLKQVVESAAIPWWGDRLSVTLSVGGATAQDGDTGETLLARAEQSLKMSVDGEAKVKIT
jgi:PAS domain S-box-containing protein/diguanylate cyclase (GGDEF)-like protein